MKFVHNSAPLERRYSEFVALQAQPQRLFPDLITPQLPGKWFFKMSTIQLQKRRAGLEAWLQEVLSVRVVHNAAPVELFLQKDGKSPVNSVFQRQILLPGEQILNIRRSSPNISLCSNGY